MVLSRIHSNKKVWSLGAICVAGAMAGALLIMWGTRMISANWRHSLTAPKPTSIASAPTANFPEKQCEVVPLIANSFNSS